MQQRRLGPFHVSAIGLGCMNMSSGYGPADDRESERLLHAALDAGYSFLDTASLYGTGHNEELIGRTLKRRRSEYVLASKCGIFKGANGKTQVDGRPEVLKRTCEESLRRLQTETIDLYYLHRMDPKVAIEESIGALGELVSAGKIRALGLSEVCTETLRRAHRVHPISAVQSEYSLWSRTPERKMLSACRELEITFVPFSPLARGFLTGKARDVTGLAETDLRCTIARPRFEPDNFAHNRQLLSRFAEFAQEVGCSMAQLALAWLLAQREQTLIPIPGTKHVDFMRENIAALEFQLDPVLVKELDLLINEQRIRGSRYTAELMATTDSERD